MLLESTLQLSVANMFAVTDFSIDHDQVRLYGESLVLQIIYTATYMVPNCTRYRSESIDILYLMRDWCGRAHGYA